MNVFALEFPPVSHLFEWPDIIFSGSLFAVNKTALIYLAAVLITSAIFLLQADNEVRWYQLEFNM